MTVDCSNLLIQMMGCLLKHLDAKTCISHFFKALPVKLAGPGNLRSKTLSSSCAELGSYIFRRAYNSVKPVKTSLNNIDRFIAKMQETFVSCLLLTYMDCCSSNDSTEHTYWWQLHKGTVSSTAILGTGSLLPGFSIACTAASAPEYHFSVVQSCAS